MSRILRSALSMGVLASLVLACDLQNVSLFGSPSQVTGARQQASPTPTPSPSPSASPAPSVSPTVDPCAAPVTAIHLGGPSAPVPVGEVFKIDVTPVSASGPLEGPLDYCNHRGRVPVVESMSANLRCSGACSGFGPQFLALGAGEFRVRIRVDAVSAEFAGTIRR